MKRRRIIRCPLSTTDDINLLTIIMMFGSIIIHLIIIILINNGQMATLATMAMITAILITATHCRFSASIIARLYCICRFSLFIFQCSIWFQLRTGITIIMIIIIIIICICIWWFYSGVAAGAAFVWIGLKLNLKFFWRCLCVCVQWINNGHHRKQTDCAEKFSHEQKEKNQISFTIIQS